MTEQEWLDCTDPNPMVCFLIQTKAERVQYVKDFPACKGSDRKLRLFACACYWRVRHLLPDARGHDAVAIAERFADGDATREQLDEARHLVGDPLGPIESRWRSVRGEEWNALTPLFSALALALQTVRPDAPRAAYHAPTNAKWALGAILNTPYASEEKTQTDLLRCFFHTVFRPATMDPRVLRCDTVVKLAEAIYHERAFDRMPILADALEECGCTDAEMLEHCRSEGPHARGCWVIDLLLGKE